MQFQHGNIKFLEFEENIKLNKPKEGFLKRSSFLVKRTVYFFTSLARCLRMFPWFITDENLVKVAPNDCLCSPKNFMDIKDEGPDNVNCTVHANCNYDHDSEGKEELQEQKRNYPIKRKCKNSDPDLVPSDLMTPRFSDIINFPRYRKLTLFDLDLVPTPI
eukprot:sb/3472853/